MVSFRDMVEKAVLSPEKREIKENVNQVRNYQQQFQKLAKSGSQQLQQEEFEAAARRFKQARGKLETAQRLLAITLQRADDAGLEGMTEKLEILDEFCDLADDYVREYQLACEAGLEQDHDALAQHRDTAQQVHSDLKQLLADNT